MFFLDVVSWASNRHVVSFEQILKTIQYIQQLDGFVMKVTNTNEKKYDLFSRLQKYLKERTPKLYV